MASQIPESGVEVALTLGRQLASSERSVQVSKHCALQMQVRLLPRVVARIVIGICHRTYPDES